MGGEWQSVRLKEDRDDRDVLLTKEAVVNINGYTPHELMALALLLEYQVGVPTPERTQHNTNSILNSTTVEGKVLTVLTIGVAVYVPFNGKKVILRNSGQVGERHSRDEDELGIEIALRSDDICTILSPKPIFANLESIGSKISNKKLSALSKKADRKNGNRTGGESENEDDERGTGSGRGSGSGTGGLYGVKIAFDLAVVDSVSGETIRDESYTPRSVASESGIQDDTKFAIAADDDDEDKRTDRSERTGKGYKKSLVSPRSPRSSRSNMDSRDRDRDKDKEGDRDRDKDKEGERDRGRDKEKDKDRDRDRGRDRDFEDGRGSDKKGRMRATDDDTHGSDDDAFSVSESVVGGDSGMSTLVLDPHLYATQRDRLLTVNRREVELQQGLEGRESGRRKEKPLYEDTDEIYSSSHFSVPRDKRSLLAQTMQAKLNNNDENDRKYNNSTNITATSDVLDDDDGANIYSTNDSNYVSSSSSRNMSTSNTKRSGVTLISDGIQNRSGTRTGPATDFSSVVGLTSGGGDEGHARDLSRGARSRLGRHGFDGTIMDSNVSYVQYGQGSSSDHADHNARMAVARISPNTYGHSRSLQQPVDTALEARDILSLHDVSIQFAGYRVGPVSTSQSGAERGTAARDTSDLYPKPKSVYFSYQFYSCEPTRTEVMRLLSSDKGQLSVLCREDSHARDEAPLAMRYLIDTSESSPSEGYDFADYLAHRSMFIDVWDADSLMLLGTCCVPLRRIMRQGQSVARCAIECDVIDIETNAKVVNGITTSIIQEGSVGVGVVVGAVQVILSNLGGPGRNKNKSLLESKGLGSAGYEGLNWRAHESKQTLDLGFSLNKKNHRPKISVRARPLSESAPELSQALSGHRVDDRNSNSNTSSMRSLTSSRGNESNRTLTYDDVAILFRRFQGSVKGTIQYSGSLMALLDIPSWSAALKKFLKMSQLAGGDKGLEMVRTHLNILIIKCYHSILVEIL